MNFALLKAKSGSAKSMGLLHWILRASREVLTPISPKFYFHLMNEGIGGANILFANVRQLTVVYMSIAHFALLRAIKRRC